MIHAEGPLRRDRFTDGDAEVARRRVNVGSVGGAATTGGDAAYWSFFLVITTPTTPSEACTELRPSAATFRLAQLREVGNDPWDAMIGRVPATVMSEPARRFGREALRLDGLRLLAHQAPMNAPRRLIVQWQDPDLRSWIPIAEVLTFGGRDGSRFELGYIAAILDARKLGFQPFLAFPELDRRYGSDTLFPFLQNWVFRTSQPDYLEDVPALGPMRECAKAGDPRGKRKGPASP